MPANRKPGPSVHIVGVEPEGPLPGESPLKELLPECRFLGGGKRHLEKTIGHRSGNPEIFAITNNVPDLVSKLEGFLAEHRQDHAVAIVLATGDPLYYGIGRQIAERIPREFLAFYPATTLIQRAFALIGESWEDVHVASIHSRKGGPIRLSQGRWAFYTDGAMGPRSLVDMATEQGFEVRSMTVLEEIGLPGQRVESFENVTPKIEFPHAFNPLNIVVMSLTEKSG